MLGCEYFNLGRDQFKRQGQTIQPETNVANGLGIFLGQLEISLNGLRSFYKEGEGRGLLQQFQG